MRQRKIVNLTILVWVTNITIDLLTRIISFNIYVLFLCRAAEIITYPRPTANPNASGINTTPPSQFSAC